MSKPIGFRTEESAIGAMLKGAQEDGQFVIPTYQREYEWGLEHLDALIEDLYEYANDIRNVHDSKKQSYFLGSIVTHQGGHDDNGSFKQYVVDGQQRMTSVTVMLSVFRDILEEVHSKVNREEWNYFKLDNVTNNNEPVTLDTLEILIKLTLGLVENNPSLESKGQDEKALRWIRKGWNSKEKKEALCHDTFHYAKKKGGSGIPGAQRNGALRKIHLAYLDLWSLFGKIDAKGGTLRKFGILEKSMVRSSELPDASDDDGGEEELILPFSDKHKHKSDAAKKKIGVFQKWQLKSVNLQDHRETLQLICDFYKILEKKVFVIKIEVDEEWNSHIIFDRANTAGKKLALMDAVRAKCYGKNAQLTKQSKEEDKKSSEKILDEGFGRISDLEPSSSEIGFFIKQYATMNSDKLENNDGKTKKLTGKGVQSYYTEFIDGIQDTEEMRVFVEGMADSFEIYHEYFLDVKPSESSGHEKSIKSLFEAFEMTGFKQHRPILMKALMGFNSGEISHQSIEKLQRAMESVYIVHNLLASNSPAEVEGLMAKEIWKVRDDVGVDSAVDGIVSGYRELNGFSEYKQDGLEEFRKRWKKANLKDGQAHFILRNIYLKMVEDSIADGITISNFTLEAPDKANLEHVLPKKPKKWGRTWYKDGNATDLHKDYLSRIGNLIILQKKDNIKASNKSWEKKRDDYSKAKSLMACKIRESETWDKDEIDGRTESLLEDYIEGIWGSSFGFSNREEE